MGCGRRCAVALFRGPCLGRVASDHRSPGDLAARAMLPQLRLGWGWWGVVIDESGSNR